MDTELIAILALWYILTLRAVHTLTIAYLGLPPTELANSSIRRAALAATARATDIDETTRRMIAERVNRGISLGLTPRQIALGTADFNGLAQLFDETWANRPNAIASTEAQNAGLSAVADRFQQLGNIRGWLARDGDYDARCAARNGRIFPPNDPPQLLHPHCRLMISPVI